MDPGYSDFFFFDLVNDPVIPLDQFPDVFVVKFRNFPADPGMFF